MALNTGLVGKTYPEERFEIEDEAVRRYTLAINEDNPVFLDTDAAGAIVAPSLFGVVYSAFALAKVMFDPELGLNMPMVVHGEQFMRFKRLVRPGDVVVSHPSVKAIDECSAGQRLTVGVECELASGEPVLSEDVLFVVRDPARKRSATAKVEPEEPDQAAFEQTMAVAQDQSLRYAEASFDRNPIHTDDAFARSVGLPGVILQGLCTMAFASKAIIDGVLDRDPSRLTAMKVRFVKPVLMGDALTTTGWVKERGEQGTTYEFVTRNQQGEAVIREGVADTWVRSTPH